MAIPPVNPATVQPGGCTLAIYAEAKQLPIEFLRQLGLSDVTYLGLPAVRIPYYDPEGLEVAIRFRIGLNGPGPDGRFRWKKGTKPLPYGLWRLGEARKLGQIALVEGESDAQTLWRHGIPALGLPGAQAWREEWADFLTGIPVVLAVIEHDAGGRAALNRLASSRIRDRVRVVALGSAKDPSELYLAAPDAFPQAWRAAAEAATPLAARIRSEECLRRGRAWERCTEFAKQSDILGCFASALEQTGLAGEVRAAKLVFLCLVSRLLDQPVSAAIKGPSAAGKSYLVQRVLEFFPATAYYALSAMSERALAYSDESLVHRFLVLFEAAGLSGELATYFVRSLLSEGQLRYETVEKTKEGLRPRLIERKGPTGLLLTTTALNLHPENETRLLSIPVTDSPEQTQRVLLELAEEGNKRVDFGSWHALQEWVETGSHRVTIPYAKLLAQAIPPAAVRLRRDFPAILSLIRAHAILHQVHRERDAKDQIVASLTDYAAVRELVADLIAQGLGAAVRPTVRETVEAVDALIASGVKEPTVQEAAKSLELDKSAAWRRVRAAIEAGYLKNLEDKRGRPARLALAEPLPEDREILPSWERISSRPGCTVAGPSPAYTPPPSPSPDRLTSDGVAASAHPLAGVLEPAVLARLEESWELLPTDPGLGTVSETPSRTFETRQETLFPEVGGAQR